MYKNKLKLFIFTLIIFSLLFISLNVKIDNIQLNVTNEYHLEGYGLCLDNCHVVRLTEANILKINEFLKEFNETETEIERGDIYYYKRISIKSNEKYNLIIMGNYLSFNSKNYISSNVNLYNYLNEIINNDKQ